METKTSTKTSTRASTTQTICFPCVFGDSVDFCFLFGEFYTLNAAPAQSHIFVAKSKAHLLEGDEAGGVGGADTGAAVRHRLVGDGELAEVVTDHTGL